MSYKIEEGRMRERERRERENTQSDKERQSLDGIIDLESCP